MISVSKKALPKIPNDQLSSQISKRHRQYICLTKGLPYWLSVRTLLTTSKFTNFVSIYLKNCWDSPCLHEKVPKHIWHAERHPKFSLPLVQCCAKSGKAMPGCGGKEWQRKLATIIEQGERGTSLTFILTDCMIVAQLSIWRGGPGILEIDTQLHSLKIKISKVIKSKQMLSRKISYCINWT